MTNQDERINAEYLAAKRRELLALRDKLSGTKSAEVETQAQLTAQASGEAREYGDDAQKLTTLELEGTLEARDTARLVNVERALRKIAEGSYGLSDASGEPIPLERLNAVPEAIYTIAEQSARDTQA